MCKRPFYHKMNWIIYFLRIPLICCLALQTVAQTKEGSNQKPASAKFADTSNPKFNIERPYYIVAGAQRIKAFINVIRQLDENTAIISVNSQPALDSLKRIIQITAANDDWKWSPPAEKLVQNSNTALRKIILTGKNPAALVAVLQTRPQLNILSVNNPSNSVIVQCKLNYAREHLLPLKEIIFIDLVTTANPETGIIGYDRSFHGINAVDFTVPGATGKNIVAGVKEQTMDSSDLDLYKRVLPSPIASPNTTNHATVIASLIGGAGSSFYDGRGIANGCRFFPSSFDNLFADDAAILNSNKVTIQNHSYGTVIQQFYGAEAVSYDNLTWLNKNFVPVFSAGNQGGSFATDGKYANMPGYANLTGNFKMAKNVITVGAVDNNGNIASESSAGPLYDGRLAPQLIALGPNGTSDAAAIVSGTIAVMQQVYADSNNNILPPASLIKAVLYNSAEDIYNAGIDYKTGYGLLNSYCAVKALQQKRYDGSSLVQGQQWTKNIIVPYNTAQLKITLCWTDSASTINNNKALVNDLDLEVKEQTTGLVYKPWVLNMATSKDSLAALPTRRRDSLNTAEQVSIRLPAAGVYEVKVIGTAVPNGSLPFHVAYSTDTLNTFMFTSPLHASDINRAEKPDLDIRWKTFVADSNQTGNLFISYTNGANWELLKAAHKISTNKYRWPIKDTNTTAILKMETSFGVFFSKPFIISKLTKLSLDFVCADSFRLSWNPHVYANAYGIFMLSDSPYLKPIRVVTDTFAVFQRFQYPSLVYAVEPLLNNGLGAARSIAIDIEQQGVQCFYKTLNYNLLDFNKLNLLLELSIATYADSVFFEKVTATGQLLQIYGGAPVSKNTLIYTLLVNEVSSGITYLRGRIKLKNGSVVYTDIIPVLTSGKNSIVFYPNPAKRNSSLHYVLQQGIPAGSQLQLFDVSGRLLKSFSSLPDNIDISAFAPGVLIYRLLGIDNQLLETGKVIIN
ncbi:MAG: C-terminal target protein [Ferruginibacter sp.]|nr:C-terminal target protein [Ferruginibacter sp.]